MHHQSNRITLGSALATALVLILALGSIAAQAVERVAVLEYFTSTT